jgi:uncharacterized protein (DUF4415 family)
MDIIDWLKSNDKKGYQTNLNNVLRWAKYHGCDINNL